MDRHDTSCVGCIQTGCWRFASERTALEGWSGRVEPDNQLGLAILVQCVEPGGCVSTDVGTKAVPQEGRLRRIDVEEGMQELAQRVACRQRFPGSLEVVQILGNVVPIEDQYVGIGVELSNRRCHLELPTVGDHVLLDTVAPTVGEDVGLLRRIKGLALPAVQLGDVIPSEAEGVVWRANHAVGDRIDQHRVVVGDT